MDINSCFYLGYVAKAIGNKGELAFKLDVDSPSSYQGLDAVFVETVKGAALVPFFLSHAKVQSNGQLRVKAEDINDLATAKTLIGKALFLPLTALPELKKGQFYYHEIIGFAAIDQNEGNIGVVKEVLDQTNNHILVVEQDQKEILIPINDQSIRDLDREKEELYVHAPEGLIALYLED